MSEAPSSLLLDRAALSKVFPDQRTMLAFEAVMKAALVGLPDQVSGLSDAGVVVTNPGSDLAEARVLTGGTGVTIDDTVANIVSIVVNVITALGYTPAKASEPFITASASGDLSAERVLTGSTGLTVDLTTPGLVSLILNVAAALGYTPANLAGDAFTGPVSIAGQMSCSALRINAGPGASSATASHSMLINLNGVGYYMLLSSTP